MSFLNSANFAIQQYANNYGNTQRSYSVIPFVLDASNAPSTIDINPNSFTIGAGKKRAVQLNYFPIQCQGSGSCSANICDAGTIVEPAQIMFDVTECTATPVYSIRKDDIRLTDNGQWDFSGTALNIIASAMPQFRQEFAKDLITKLYDLAGVHIDGSATKKIHTTDGNTGVVNPIGKYEIEREFLDGGFMPPYILGGAEVYNWKKMVSIGGLNANGQNISMIDTGNSYYDDGLSANVLNDLVNGDHVLAIDPQVFKFVTYAENAGIFRTGMADISDLPNLYRGNFGGFLEGSLIDPVTGLLLDLDIKYDECNKRWNLQLRLIWDIFVMPDIACNVQGVNGIMHYRTCPQVQIACPAGSPVTSPSNTQVYDWTPTLSQVPMVSQITIGNREWRSNTPVTITTITQLAAVMNEAYSPSKTTFIVNGSKIEYSGNLPISGSFNNGGVPFTFA